MNMVARDFTEQELAARLQQAVDGLEVCPLIGFADLLEHSDRRDLVKAALHRRIVAQFERNLVFETEPRDLFPRIRELFLRQCHAMGANASPELTLAITARAFFEKCGIRSIDR